MADSFFPVLPFDTDEPEFARGFEAGRIWERLRHGEEFDQLIHATNAEMVLRMAESVGAPVTAEHVDDKWMLLKCDEWEGENVG